MATKPTPAAAEAVTTPWVPFTAQNLWFSLQEGRLCASMILPNGDRNGTLQAVDFDGLEAPERRSLEEIADFLRVHAARIRETVERAERAFWQLVAETYPEAGMDPETNGAAAVNLGTDLRLAMIYAATNWVRTLVPHARTTAARQEPAAASAP